MQLLWKKNKRFGWGIKLEIVTSRPSPDGSCFDIDEATSCRGRSPATPPHDPWMKGGRWWRRDERQAINHAEDKRESRKGEKYEKPKPLLRIAAASRSGPDFWVQTDPRPGHNYVTEREPIMAPFFSIYIFGKSTFFERENYFVPSDSC